jgi:hypothetical protein
MPFAARPLGQTPLPGSDVADSASAERRCRLRGER